MYVQVDFGFVYSFMNAVMLLLSVHLIEQYNVNWFLIIEICRPVCILNCLSRPFTFREKNKLFSY